MCVWMGLSLSHLSWFMATSRRYDTIRCSQDCKMRIWSEREERVVKFYDGLLGCLKNKALPSTHPTWSLCSENQASLLPSDPFISHGGGRRGVGKARRDGGGEDEKMNDATTRRSRWTPVAKLSVL